MTLSANSTLLIWIIFMYDSVLSSQRMCFFHANNNNLPTGFAFYSFAHLDLNLIAVFMNTSDEELFFEIKCRIVHL